ncbi:MAG: response regulator transcription factor [Acidobacteriia bacterium]|nr:response regulator transcription factor [Terriglobia bacterium]
MKKTVVICDTQPIAIEGLRALMAQHHELAVAGEATSMVAGMELVRNMSPSILIVDKSFGLQPVMDWIANLRASGRRTAAVVWGNAINEAEALRLVQVGAQGVIRKTATLRALLDCLRMVAAGNTWMDELMFQSADKTNGTGRSSLTSREQQVAELVEQGMKNKEIARALGICAGTVKIHLKHIFEKTGVRGRYGLALSGLKERGYLPAARYN